jgi:hypothetical protein
VPRGQPGSRVAFAAFDVLQVGGHEVMAEQWADRVRVKRVLMPDGRELPLHEEPVYFLRWELVTTARLYDALPADVRRIG